MIVLRFAPSPTGNLHIGGARTALYNWLYCRKNNGKFILRIDDTDLARNQSDSMQSIIDDLKWLGIDWDIGPDKSSPTDYQSSHRNDIYLKYAQLLIDQDKAYKDIDGSIRIKVLKDNSTFTFNDLLKGDISIQKNTLNDFVLIRSSNIATYNFATVIDDHLMGVTHIFRADEHLLNTPKQLLVYQSFGWTPPVFGHMGLITDLSGKKLSKRSGDSSVSDFKQKGILNKALVNYLAFLGWGDNNQGQLLSLDQLIKKFNINKVKSSSSCFDNRLLNSINTKYIKNLTLTDLSILLNCVDFDYLQKFSNAFLIRSSSINDLIYFHTQLTSIDIAYDWDSMTDFAKNDLLKCLDHLINRNTDTDVVFGKKLSSSVIRFAMIGQKDGCGNDLLLKMISPPIIMQKYLKMRHALMFFLNC